MSKYELSRRERLTVAILRALARPAMPLGWLCLAYAAAVGYYLDKVAGYQRPQTYGALLSLPYYVAEAGILALLVIPVELILKGVAGRIERRPTREAIRDYERLRTAGRHTIGGPRQRAGEME